MTNVEVTSRTKHDADLTYLSGYALLILGLPLLVWQIFPENQLAIIQSDFLVVHSMMETFSVIVSALIFFTVYGTRDTAHSLRMIVLGCAFFATAMFDTFHFLSYISMPDFITPNSPNKSILFWLAARFSVGFGLLLYVAWPWANNNQIQWTRLVFLLTFIVIISVTAIILFLPDHLPAMFVTGIGLSEIKIILECRER